MPDTRFSLLHEPLLHFLLIGAVLFLLFRWVDDEPRAAGEIVVTRGQIEQLATSFRLVWQREPTEPEMDGLIEDYIREEVLYREAVAMGLDRDDTIIRRRMRQKLEFLAEDLSAQMEPAEQDLQSWFEEHGDSYGVEEQYTFEQVYFSPQRRGDNLDRDIRNALRELSDGSDGVDAADLGDPILLPGAFTAMPRTRVEQTFGSSFAASLDKLSPGAWAGPLDSGYGQHAVRLVERLPARLPQLAEVRDAVLRDWSAAQRQKTLDAHYQALREKYTIQVEPETAAGPGGRR